MMLKRIILHLANTKCCILTSNGFPPQIACPLNRNFDHVLGHLHFLISKINFIHKHVQQIHNAVHGFFYIHSAVQSI